MFGVGAAAAAICVEMQKGFERRLKILGTRQSIPAIAYDIVRRLSVSRRGSLTRTMVKQHLCQRRDIGETQNRCVGALLRRLSFHTTLRHEVASIRRRPSPRCLRLDQAGPGRAVVITGVQNDAQTPSRYLPLQQQLPREAASTRSCEQPRCMLLDQA